MRHLRGHKPFALVLAGLSVAIVALPAQAQTGDNLIRNGTFDDALAGDHFAFWGIYTTVDPVDTYPPLTLDGFAASFDSGGFLLQSLSLTTVGLGSDATVRSATLSLNVYNPDTAVVVQLITGTGMSVATIPAGTDYVTPFEADLSDLNLKEGDTLSINARTGQAVVDNVQLIVNEYDLGGGSGETPVPTPPTPAPTPTVTPTGSPSPTPTISPTPTESPTPEGTVTPTPTEIPTRFPAGITVTANPSLLLLPPGGDLLTAILGESGVESTIVVELVGSDGSQMPILMTTDTVLYEPIGVAEVGRIKGGGLRDDGTYEFTFEASNAGTAVYQITFKRTGDPATGGKDYYFTDVVNIMIRKDRSESILGGEGAPRARLNPPRNRTIYFDRSD